MHINLLSDFLLITPKRLHEWTRPSVTRAAQGGCCPCQQLGWQPSQRCVGRAYHHSIDVQEVGGYVAVAGKTAVCIVVPEVRADMQPKLSAQADACPYQSSQCHLEVCG